VQVDVRVRALSLVARAAIVVPHRKIFHLSRLRVQGLGLGPDALASTINPDVGGLHHATLGKAHVLLEHGLVGLAELHS